MMKVILGGLEEIKEAMNNELLDDRKDHYQHYHL